MQADVSGPRDVAFRHDAFTAALKALPAVNFTVFAAGDVRETSARLARGFAVAPQEIGLLGRWPLAQTPIVIRQQSLLKPSVLALTPAAESAFHIAGFNSNLRSIIISPLENIFYIVKIDTYLIEK